METIELWSGNTKAIIDLEGAWLTNLSDDNGDILFPKRQLTAPDNTTKTRGGCHVCLPNFGPGGESGLAQHGFGRIVPWEVTRQKQDTLELTLEGGTEEYKGLISTLIYELAEASLSISLHLANKGDAELRLSPAFHPYFALQSGETQVKIDGQATELEDLAGTLFETGEAKELLTARRHFRLASEGLSTWALWTDRLGAYVCVEPTFGGYAFLETESREEERLLPGQKRSHTFTISW